jgi:branched-chain amino acid transport system permease protein
MNTTLLVLQVLNGLQFGVLLFLVAAGLTLVFGIMDLVNLAHGALYMVGAFLCAVLTLSTGSLVWGILLALPLVAVVGLATEVTVVRWLYARDHLDHVLATFGLVLIFGELGHILWGTEGIAVPLPSWLQGWIQILPGIRFPLYRLVIIGSGLSIALGLYYLVTHTRLGMLIRAGASNRTMLGALGVDVQTLFTLVFGLGAVLAGFAGMMITPITQADLGMGNAIIITAFVVIVVGGIGSMKGAFVGAIVVGLMDTLGRAYFDDLFKLFISSEAAETLAPAFSAMMIYVLMAIILALRPQGLFPPKVR